MSGDMARRRCAGQTVSRSPTRSTAAGTVTEAMLYAFDVLEVDGEDLRDLPLVDRKNRLARLLGAAGAASS
jgi:ATP-dependent DNA ligase